MTRARRRSRIALTETISGLAQGTFLTRDGRAQARRAREARRRRGQARRRSTSRPPRLPRRRSPTTRRRQAHGLALPRPAPAEEQPDLPHPDHARARAAHLLGRARLHRDSHPQAHGERVSESQPSCSRWSTSRARPTSRRARSSSSRWRSPPASARSSRSRPAFRADPSFTSRHATEFTSRRRRDQLDRLARRRHAAARGAARGRLTRPSRTSTAPRSRPLFGVEVTVPDAAVPAHPARRGEAHRRRARLRGAARRRRHGPRGRAPHRAPT